MKYKKEISSGTSYLNPSRFISGRIVEYDIRSANISALLDAGAIDIDQYNRLNIMTKDIREKEIGLLIRDNPKIYDIIKEKILESRNYFLESNNIDPNNIIRIANDAVYINTHVDLQYTKYGNTIEYRQKSISNIYINLNKILFFIGFLPDGNISVDVKGLGKKSKLHEQYIISFIAYTITILERSGIVEAINYFNDITQQYLALQLPVGYYRELNEDSGYRVKNYNRYILSEIGEQDKYILDIGYNYNIIRELWSILIELYSMRR